MDWKDFVESYENNRIEPRVDLNKGHAVMKQPEAPFHWRFWIKLMTALSIIAVPVGIVLLFFTKWWIGILMIFIGLVLMNPIRKAAAIGLIEETLKDEDLYNLAMATNAMALFKKEE